MIKTYKILKRLFKKKIVKMESWVVQKIKTI